MNYEAFCAGMGSSLLKQATFANWLWNNAIQPAAQGHIDSHYGGLFRVNTDTNGFEPNTGNALRAITGATPTLAKPTESGGLLRRGFYNLGASRLGKWIGNKIVPDSAVNARLNAATKGVFSTDGAGIQVDRSRIPAAIADKVKNWTASHGQLLKGMGFGAAALGLGALALNNRKPPQRQQQSQVAAPAGQLPAPYAGREGNTFTKYQEI